MDPALYGQVSKRRFISQPILDTRWNGKKSFKIITVTNRINEHTADYATDYIKIKDLALKKKNQSNWFEEKIKETYIKILRIQRLWLYQQLVKKIIFREE
jgi:peptidyl-prolyl cis-trans isomerase SurA